MGTNKVIFKFIKIAFSIMMALIILYGTVSVAVVAYDFGYRVFTEKPMDEDAGKRVRVIIEPGMSGKEIGDELVEKGLIRDANLFVLQMKLSIYDDKLLPGTYILNTSMTAKEMMAVMATPPASESTESTGE
jgi:UPF0755 protein